MNLASRILLVTGAVVAALIVLLVLWRSSGRPVDVAVVDRGPVEEIIRATGHTRLRDRYIVTAPAAGFLPHHQWHPGDALRAGEELLQLPLIADAPIASATNEIPRLEAALAAAQANVETARARLELATSEHAQLTERADEATSRFSLPAFALRDAQRHLHSAEFAIDVARYELNTEKMRQSLSGDAGAVPRFPVRAPVTGIMLSVLAEGGREIERGTPLFEIGNPGSLEIESDVRTTTATSLQTGTPVRITGWNGERPLHGRVRRVDPVAFTRTVDGVAEQRVRITIGIASPREHWQRLGDGYPVDVAFVTWRGENVLRVPAAALFPQEDRWLVFRLRDEHAYGTPVDIGHRGEDFAEVLNGLHAGDHVVLGPVEDISEGQRVLAN